MSRYGDTLVVFDRNDTIMSDVARAVGATNTVLTARGPAGLTEERFRDGFSLPLAGRLAGLGVVDADAAEDERNRALAAAPAEPRSEAAAVLAELVGHGALTGVVSAALDPIAVGSPRCGPTSTRPGRGAGSGPSGAGWPTRRRT
ncbi:hypothetical protein [Pseudonocardia abyssalis]|uniref:Uncharacterized protein n=1 Tax=Pseudonocardia abyssalis TaxID=2792008 RepID=A0ABS6UQA0_9PSEU|nr:hypothetical protein [Pseudonocardia abyssalis]MBW0134404.1 hypothetical protein [Pseudonocardia abyssalis]